MARDVQISRLRVGTSGYSYPGSPPQGWYGAFYPSNKGKGFSELEYYSSFFDTVEINSTFYRPPTPGMASAWVQKTFPSFEFAVKMWQKFTHSTAIGQGTCGAEEGRKAPGASDVDLFKKGIGPLAESGRLGALLFQYPAGFHSTNENVERLQKILKEFEDYPKVVELRHRSWSDKSGETKTLLLEHGANWAFIDEPKFASSVKQVFEPFGEIFYLRLHGRNRQKWWSHKEAWERYDYLYSQEEVRFFGDKIRQLRQKFSRAKVYVFFNNHARGQAVANGLMLKSELGQGITGRLPPALIEAYPQLSGLDGPLTQGTLF